MTVLELYIDGKFHLRKQFKRSGNHYKGTTYQEKIDYEIKVLKMIGRRSNRHWEVFTIKKSKMNRFKRAYG